MKLNKNGYLTKYSNGETNKCRDWWLAQKTITIIIPDELIGKRFKIKIEVINDEKKRKN